MREKIVEKYNGRGKRERKVGGKENRMEGEVKGVGEWEQRRGEEELDGIKGSRKYVFFGMWRG